MYKYIEKLQPHFYSLREIGDKVSLDLKIPTPWGFKQEYGDVKIQLQDENEQKRIISIIALSTEGGYINVFKVALEIITTNKEEEEKIKLFNEKMSELKEIFLNSSLDTIKGISFNTNERNKDTEDV
jgi:hypothetical protein